MKFFKILITKFNINLKHESYSEEYVFSCVLYYYIIININIGIKSKSKYFSIKIRLDEQVRW